MNENTVTDSAASAVAALNKVREALILAASHQTDATDGLRRAIVRIRPLGILTVDEMAEAVGRDRNYIDSVWSSYGDPVKGKQTRVSAEASDEQMLSALHILLDAASDQRWTASTLRNTRAERNQAITTVYASKSLGPSAIAAAVGVDRNHVLRLARKAGLTPAWRPAGTARNQHTASK